MNSTTVHLLIGLEDLLAELQHARRNTDLGRLALLCCCEVASWSRRAGEQQLAQRASALVGHWPHASREQFLAEVDELVAELQALRARL